MAVTDLGAAIEKAVVVRTKAILTDIEDRDPAREVVIGIAVPGPPTWTGTVHVQPGNRGVRFVACPSVLAVLDALAGGDDEPEGDLVVLTHLSEDELGEAIMSRLYRNRLFSVSKETLLADILQPKQVDVRLQERQRAWLTEALIEMAQLGEASSLHGTVLTLEVAISRVLRERLGLDADDLDLIGVVAMADDTTRRARWRSLPRTHRQGIVDWLVERLGEPAGLVMRLADDHDDVLADLLVADVLTTAGADSELATLFGGFAGLRWGSPLPSTADVHAAALAAVSLARSEEGERIAQQVRRANKLLIDLGGKRFAVLSDVLPTGFEERLNRAVETLEGPTSSRCTSTWTESIRPPWFVESRQPYGFGAGWTRQRARSATVTGRCETG